MSKLLIGWAEESITPNVPVSLVGQFYERISQYVETPLTVTALAIEAGGDHAIIVSGDLTSASYSLLSQIREHLTDVEDLDPIKVTLGATHTHTSVSYTDAFDFGGFDVFGVDY